MSERESAGSMLMAFIAGAAAGALAGVLLAPRSGKESRDRLSELGQDWAEKARKAAEAAARQVRDGVHEGQELAEHEIEAAKSAWKAGRDAWQRSHDSAAV